MEEIMENNNQVNRNEEALNLLKLINDLEAKADLKNNLKDNKLYFTHKDVRYRIRKPIPKEQMELEKYKLEKYKELVDNDKMLFKSQWLEKYKKKGIDIDKMDKEMADIDKELERIQIRLAQTENKSGVESLKGTINKLRTKKTVLFMKKQDLLSYSIEEQLKIESSSFCTYLILEKEDSKDTWKKAFESYETFLNCEDDELLNKAFYYISYLLYGDYE